MAWSCGCGAMEWGAPTVGPPGVNRLPRDAGGACLLDYLARLAQSQLSLTQRIALQQQLLSPAAAAAEGGWSSNSSSARRSNRTRRSCWSCWGSTACRRRTSSRRTSDACSRRAGPQVDAAAAAATAASTTAATASATADATTTAAGAGEQEAHGGALRRSLIHVRVSELGGDQTQTGEGHWELSAS